MPYVYVVEGSRLVDPSRLGVVNKELDVWWNPRRLDGAQVDTDDFGLGVLIAHCKQTTASFCQLGAKFLCMAHGNILSMAHMPVPVPISRIVCGFCSGA